MAGLSFASAAGKAVNNRYPPYYARFFERLDEALAQGGGQIADQGLFFRLLIAPRPLQDFFADYLTRDLHLLSRAYEAETSTPLSAIFRRLLHTAMNNPSHLVAEQDILNPDWIRQFGAIPFTRKQIATLTKGLQDPYIVATAAVIQSGFNDYYQELRAILDIDYRLDEKSSAALERLGIGLRSQSFWNEFLPLLAVTYNPDHKFADTLHTAWNNQTFRTQGNNKEITECPARFMVRQIMNTDFIPQADGTLAAGKTPRDGAMLSCLYGRLRAQGELAPLPAYTLVKLP